MSHLKGSSKKRAHCQKTLGVADAPSAPEDLLFRGKSFCDILLEYCREKSVMVTIVNNNIQISSWIANDQVEIHL